MTTKRTVKGRVDVNEVRRRIGRIPAHTKEQLLYDLLWIFYGTSEDTSYIDLDREPDKLSLGQGARYLRLEFLRMTQEKSDAEMSLKQARSFFKKNYDRLRELFYAEHTAPTGGLLNPRVMAVENGDLVIRCHYDNYDNDEDAWTWYLDPKTDRFYT